MDNFDLDGAVQGEVQDLIARMRAKRLSAELPLPEQAPAEPAEPGADESGDLAALESMLEPG